MYAENTAWNSKKSTRDGAYRARRGLGEPKRGEEALVSPLDPEDTEVQIVVAQGGILNQHEGETGTWWRSLRTWEELQALPQPPALQDIHTSTQHPHPQSLLTGLPGSWDHLPIWALTNTWSTAGDCSHLSSQNVAKNEFQTSWNPKGTGKRLDPPTPIPFPAFICLWKMLGGGWQKLYFDNKNGRNMCTQLFSLTGVCVVPLEG